MRKKQGRAAFIGILLVLILIPTIAYASDTLSGKPGFLLSFDATTYITLMTVLVLLCVVVFVFILMSRLRAAKEMVCRNYSCAQHPLRAKSRKKNRGKAAAQEVEQAAQVKSDSHSRQHPERKPVRNTRQHLPKQNVGFENMRTNSNKADDLSYFKTMDTPREILDIPSPNDTAKFAAMRAKTAAGASPACSKQNQNCSSQYSSAMASANQSSPRLTSNYGVQYHQHDSLTNTEPMDLTLGMIENVLKRLDNRDASIQASLLQHSGATGQFANVNSAYLQNTQIPANHGYHANAAAAQNTHVGLNQPTQMPYAAAGQGYTQHPAVNTGQFPSVLPARHSLYNNGYVAVGHDGNYPVITTGQFRAVAPEQYSVISCEQYGGNTYEAGEVYGYNRGNSPLGQENYGVSPAYRNVPEYRGAPDFRGTPDHRGVAEYRGRHSKHPSQDRDSMSTGELALREVYNMRHSRNSSQLSGNTTGKLRKIS